MDWPSNENGKKTVEHSHSGLLFPDSGHKVTGHLPLLPPRLHSAASHSSMVLLGGSYIFPGVVLKAGFPTWACSRWSSVQLSLKGSPIPSAN